MRTEEEEKEFEKWVHDHYIEKPRDWELPVAANNATSIAGRTSDVDSPDTAVDITISRIAGFSPRSDEMIRMDAGRVIIEAQKTTETGQQA